MLSIVDLEDAAEYLRDLAEIIDTESIPPRVRPTPRDLRDLADVLESDAKKLRLARYGHRPRRA